jgi:hypothetical protein
VVPTSSAGEIIASVTALLGVLLFALPAGKVDVHHKHMSASSASLLSWAGRRYHFFWLRGSDGTCQEGGTEPCRAR